MYNYKIYRAFGDNMQTRKNMFDEKDIIHENSKLSEIAQNAFVVKFLHYIFAYVEVARYFEFILEWLNFITAN